MNEYSWTNLSSMLFIEQPVGTGYSQGTPDIKNEDDLAAQFVGFLQQFLEVFCEAAGFGVIGFFGFGRRLESRRRCIARHHKRQQQKWKRSSVFPVR